VHAEDAAVQTVAWASVGIAPGRVAHRVHLLQRMKSHRRQATDEQIEHHSLPGINMAGKGAPEKDCEPSDERERSQQPRAPADRRPAAIKPDAESD